MKKNLLLGILLAALAGLPAASAAPAADSNRYLLVFETTRSMKRDMAAARQCVQDLITGGFADQARDGDTVGVWTYDSSLHAGIFPMQEWTEDGSTDLAQHLDAFLKQQRCKGDAHFDQVMAELNRVISNSDSITILIFSDGYDPIEGTPFDSSINGVYAQHRQELRDAHVPFVTLLQAQGGKIVHGTVDSAVGPIDIPAPPSKPGPPVTIAAPAPAPAPPQVVVVVKTNAPLILDYSKTTAQNPPATAPAVSQAPAAPINNPPPAPGLVASALSAITNMIGSSDSAPKPAATPAPIESQPAAPVTVPPPALTAAPAANASPGGLILAGLGLVLALGGLAVLFFWRTRSTPRASVITESFNQTKK